MIPSVQTLKGVIVNYITRDQAWVCRSHLEYAGENPVESKEAYSTNRSLIAFPAWSSFAHAAVMAVMAFQKADYRGDLWGVAALVIIGVALIVLAPAKQLIERVSAAVVQARTRERHARLIQSLE